MRATVLFLALCLLFSSVPAFAQSDDQTPDYVITEDVVQVEPGTTMFYLVRDFYPNHRNDWLRVARDLAKANPQAFRNGDPGALIVGKDIRLIDYGDGVAQSETTEDAPDVESDNVDESPSNEPTAPPAVPTPDAAAAVSDSVLTSIGQISRLRGTPIAIDLNNRQRTLRSNATIYRGDTLLTEAGERLTLLMLDGAVVRVREDTRLTFEKYRFDVDATDTNASVMTLIRGGLRLTTGDLADVAGGVFINTAVATLATTGGDLALRICESDACRPPDLSTALPAALYTGVALGEVSASNNTGEAEAVRGEVLRVRDADTPAQLTDDALGVVFAPDELTTLDLQSDQPLGFFAWFRQRFFSFGDSRQTSDSED
ncbi:MAG: hypothetical protein AB8G17_11930 [Gammaproteobacteria bacterium]